MMENQPCVMKTAPPNKELRLKKTGHHIKRGLNIGGQGIWAACIEMSLRQDVPTSVYGEKFRRIET
jgi:hypothetical protein